MQSTPLAGGASHVGARRDGEPKAGHRPQPLWFLPVVSAGVQFLLETASAKEILPQPPYDETSATRVRKAAVKVHSVSTLRLEKTTFCSTEACGTSRDGRKLLARDRICSQEVHPDSETHSSFRTNVSLLEAYADRMHSVAIKQRSCPAAGCCPVLGG